MRHFEKTRINTFFVEMIIVVLFFSVAATIIVKVFAVTNFEITRNKVKSQAIINAGSLADLYTTNQDLVTDLVMLFGNNGSIRTDEKGRYLIELNEELIADKQNKIVTLDIKETKKETKSGRMGKLVIRYFYQNENIYEIEASSYKALK